MGNKIVHWELMGSDGVAMQKFYKDMFDWNTEGVEGFDQYFMVDADSAGAAGAVGRGPEQMPSYMTFYIEVPDIDAHLARIEEAGGKTMMPRTVVPDVVTYAMFSDPAGNVVGLVEPES